MNDLETIFEEMENRLELYYNRREALEDDDKSVNYVDGTIKGFIDAMELVEDRIDKLYSNGTPRG